MQVQVLSGMFCRCSLTDKAHGYEPWFMQVRILSAVFACRWRCVSTAALEPEGQSDSCLESGCGGIPLRSFEIREVNDFWEMDKRRRYLFSRMVCEMRRQECYLLLFLLEERLKC